MSLTTSASTTVRVAAVQMDVPARSRSTATGCLPAFLRPPARMPGSWSSPSADRLRLRQPRRALEHPEPIPGPTVDRFAQECLRAAAFMPGVWPSNARATASTTPKRLSAPPASSPAIARSTPPSWAWTSSARSRRSSVGGPRRWGVEGGLAHLLRRQLPWRPAGSCRWRGADLLVLPTNWPTHSNAPPFT